ncbi:hypothetical protein [Chlamydiifrater phoenicopteri]|uniref:hypothetical protein n=1 Tax=Chlamydiifrater phoenicopteri TaxID=2681469 RepID=UPI001BCEBF7E|nr:hypothetical protein [Chlamydiifrater phoenicopteri]
MSPNKDKILISTPGFLWLFGGINLTKGALLLFIKTNSNELPVYGFLTILAILLGKAKYRFCLSKTVERQLLKAFSVPEKLSCINFLRDTFVSKKMAAIFIIAASSAVICSQISHLPTLFFVRLTVGTALLRAAFAYLTPISAGKTPSYR